MNYLVLNRIQLYGFASFKKLSFQISDNTVYIHIYLSTYASVLYISIYICLLLTFLIVMKTGEEKREPFFFFSSSGLLQQQQKKWPEKHILHFPEIYDTSVEHIFLWNEE